MVTLRNIKKDNKTISAEYEPENSGLVGSIKLDIASGNVIDSVSTELDNPFPMYLFHATRALEKLAQKDNVPEEKMVMWY